MPITVGIDLVSPETIVDSIGAQGDRYLERVFTAGELADCRTPEGADPSRLAARFAAKEATIKALRPAADDALPWREIEVRRGQDGLPRLTLSGSAATLATERGVLEVAVSLSNHKGMASAIVIAELGRGNR